MTRFVVEPLPPHPNLEHQQKLAKRLLRDCCRGALKDARSVLKIEGAGQCLGARSNAGRVKGSGRWSEHTVVMRVPESRVEDILRFLERDDVEPTCPLISIKFWFERRALLPALPQGTS